MKKFLASGFFKALWSVGLATLFYYVCPPCFSKTTAAIVLGILVVLVNGSKLISKVPILTHVARFLVGGLFIFSGFIKANDPLGFSYKLGEYFEVFKADTGLAISLTHNKIAKGKAMCAKLSKMDKPVSALNTSKYSPNL